MSGEKKKMDPTVSVAIISGTVTLIAALISSPILLDYLKNKNATETAVSALTTSPGTTAVSVATATQPMPTPGEAVLTFDQNFDNDVSTGFAFGKGQWQLAKEKSNPMLEGNATGLSSDVATAEFGPADFKDGVIEFQIKFKQPLGFYLNFRENSSEQYLLYLSPADQEISLGYNGENINWHMQPFSGASTRAFSFSTNTWYTVRIEVQGTSMTAWVDNGRLFTSQDSRLQQGGLSFAIDEGGNALIDNVKVWEYGK